MCNGFGAIVDKTLHVWFIEPDNSGDISYSDILQRLGKENCNTFIRHSVSVECPNWTIDSFRFDEDGTLPGWAEAAQTEIRERVQKILAKITPAWAEYDAKITPAWAEYDAKITTAWAEYEAKRATAKAEYEAKRAPAEAEMIRKFSALPGYVK